jgi:predicted ATPase
MRLFEGLARFLAHLSTRDRLLLVLEDLHWATESTLQLVHYLVRHLAAHPVLLVAHLRPGGGGPAASAAGASAGAGTRGAVGAAGPGGLCRCRRSSCWWPRCRVPARRAVPLARRLYAETEGNPFFLMELVRAPLSGVASLEGGRWQGDFSRISQATCPCQPG